MDRRYLFSKMTPMLLKYHAAITLRVYVDAISSSEPAPFFSPPLWIPFVEPAVPDEDGRRILVVGEVSAPCEPHARLASRGCSPARRASGASDPIAVQNPLDNFRPVFWSRCPTTVAEPRQTRQTLETERA